MKGILFKPDMIQASVEGRKTHTRRLGGLEEINKEPDKWNLEWFNPNSGIASFCRGDLVDGVIEITDAVAKSRYQVGETVYIKERALYWVSPVLEGVKYTKPSDRWTECVYQDDEEISALLADNRRLAIVRGVSEIVEGNLAIGKWEWKSSLHMPEHYARHFITILAVRAERLQEITPEDCIAEGIIEECGDGLALRDRYEPLWSSINPTYPFESNPWVFPYEFVKEMG